MSKDFDKSDFDKSSPNRQYGEDAQKWLEKTQSSIDSIRLEHLACSCGFHYLFNSPLFNVYFHDVTDWGQTINFIIGDIIKQAEIGRTEIVISLGHANQEPVSSHYIVKADGRIVVACFSGDMHHGLDPSDQLPPQPIKWPPENRNQMGRQPLAPTADVQVNHDHIMESNRRCLFHPQKWHPNDNWRRNVDQNYQRPPRASEFFRGPYPAGFDQWLIDVGDLSPVEAMSRLETLFPDHRKSPNHMHQYTAYIDVWQSNPPEMRILNFNMLCNHCWMLLLRHHLHMMGFETELLPAFHDMSVRQTTVAHDVNPWSEFRGPHHRAPHQDGYMKHTSRAEIRMRIWGWQEQMEEKE